MSLEYEPASEPLRISATASSPALFPYVFARVYSVMNREGRRRHSVSGDTEEYTRAASGLCSCSRLALAEAVPDAYRGTSPIRKRLLLGHYSRAMSRALW